MLLEQNAKQEEFGILNAQPLPDTSAKNKVVIFTLASIVFGFISATIGYFISAENPWVRKQITELLNFQITITIVMFVAIILDSTVILSVIGLPLMILFGILNFIFLIIGTTKASKGTFYKYPLTLRLLS